MPSENLFYHFLPYLLSIPSSSGSSEANVKDDTDASSENKEQECQIGNEVNSDSPSSEASPEPRPGYLNSPRKIKVRRMEALIDQRERKRRRI